AEQHERQKHDALHESGARNITTLVRLQWTWVTILPAWSRTTTNEAERVAHSPATQTKTRTARPATSARLISATQSVTKATSRSRSETVLIITGMGRRRSSSRTAGTSR